MFGNLIKNAVCESKSMLTLCRVLIETQSFQSANAMLDSLIYNFLNLSHINQEIQNHNNICKNSFIFFVEGNGHGHATQMLQIYDLIKDSYNCVGVVMGRQKNSVNEFADKYQIPLLNLQEPEFVSDTSVNKLTTDTLKFIFDYSIKHYKCISEFVSHNKPEFIINLHLPIKIFSAITRPVINISSQNRLNFQEDYKTVISYKEFEKYQTDSVLFSSYVIHNSCLKIHKFAINSVDDLSTTTLPPLIDYFPKSTRTKKEIICYFNKEIPIDLLTLFEQFPDFSFYIYSNFMQQYSKIAYPANVYFENFGTKFNEQRKYCVGIISSCGFETICENFQLAIPMLCLPMNPEQLYNAFDHSRKIPGFFWTFKIEKSDIENILNFEYNQEYWRKHSDFCSWLSKKEKLKNKIKNCLS